MKKHRPLESVFQSKVMRKLKLLKNTWAYKASDRVRSGIPDIIACVNGRFVALELKRDKREKATPLQLYTLDLIEKAQGRAVVVTPEDWDLIWSELILNAGGLK